MIELKLVRNVMTRGAFLSPSRWQRICSLMVLLAGGFFFGQPTAAAARSPNFLFIVADDLGFSDLGCYGGEIATPRLDALAENGLRLARFYNTGRCCPSRASILTGQYPHRVGLGHMVKDLGQPGYAGRLADDALTIAQVLRPAGYRSFISGKWHLGTDDPTRHGFEEFYGTLASAKSFWDPGHFLRRPAGRPSRSYAKEMFYATDAVTDHALDFLRTARETPDKPWFLYLAYHAPHFPLQAPQEEIAKYAGRYLDGWDALRQERLARMKQLGLVPDETSLTPRSAFWDWGESQGQDNPAWDTLSKGRRADLARRMAIYAGMVDRMDQNIGRIVDFLRRHGELENTFLIFFSDNGACAEWDPFGFDHRSGPANLLHEGEALDEMGGPETYHSLGSGWANACNTPWRLYKHYNHEGGVSTPCIIHWPAGLNRKGEIDHRPAHIIDLMPTVIEASGANYSEDKAPPLAGRSLLSLLRGEAVDPRALYFEHQGNRAIMEGPWKLTALRGQPWELYQLENDRTELRDLAQSHPGVAARLAAQWQRWAESHHVLPFPKDYGVGYLPVE